MFRILLAIFLCSGLCACEGCPETSSGLSQGSSYYGAANACSGTVYNQ